MLLIYLLQIGSSNESLFGFDLLKHLIEFKETFYLEDHGFIIKGYNSGIARWKRYTGQGTGKERRVSLPFPGALLSQNLGVFTNQKLYELCLLRVLWKLHDIVLTY